MLAIDRVRFYGEPVALVAAEHPEQARRAAAAVEVDYEPLPAVTDAERATEMEPLHPDRPTMGHGYRDDPRPNVVRHMVIRHGDPADRRRRHPSRASTRWGSRIRRSSGPSPGLAVPDGEGGVDVYVATQWLHVDRDQVAPCLALPPEQVRIHLAGVGGAFGGREDLSMQIHSALLALHANRPVKMVYNREESFTGHVHRHPAKIWCEHRATREGRLVNVRMRILLDGGAYASSSTAVCSNAASFAVGPYSVDNALIEATAVYTNNPPCGAMRGFGAVQTCFAAEAQMDRLADGLGIDPVELRLLNALKPGDTLPTGQVITGSLPTADVIRRAAAIPVPEPETAAARPAAPAGRGGQHDPRPGCSPGRGICGRLQEHLLLGGLRRLLRRPRGAARRRQRARALRRGRGRPGCERRDPPGRPHRARQRPRRAGAAHDRDVGSAGSASASRMTWMAAGAVRDACRAALEERDRAGGERRRRAYLPAPRTSPLDPETRPGHG